MLLAVPSCLLPPLTPPVRACMQVGRAEKKAKSVTWEDVRDGMEKYFMPLIKATVRANPSIFPNGIKDVLILMDNAPWHKRALEEGLAEHLGLGRHQFLTQPPSSPDLNSPVEKAHALLLSAVMPKISGDASLDESKKLQRLLKTTWEKGGENGTTLVSADAARGLFSKLEETYRQVEAAGGEYGHKDN